MADSLELTSARAVATVDLEHGGRLASLQVDGHDLLWTDRRTPVPARHPMTWGAFPMAPFAGRVRNGRVAHGGAIHQLRLNLPPHSIHGSVYDRPWRVDEYDGRAATITTVLGEYWPWPGICRQHLVLDADQLTWQMEVETDDEAFPASIGWHPWFRTRLDDGAELRLDVEVGRQWERDDEGLPSGAFIRPLPRPWDDCFTDVRWPAVLTWENAMTLTIDSDCDHVVIYDEQAHAWCVEPQTAPPDALGGASRLVTTTDPLRAVMTWRW